MTTYSLWFSFPKFEPAPCSMSSSNYCFFSCIQLSQEAGNVVWYSHLTKNIPQFVMIHTVKVGEAWQWQRGMACMYSKGCGTRTSQVAQWKESACQSRRCRRHSFNCWVKKIPWRRKWQASILAWRTPCTKKPSGLQPIGPQRVGHDWVTEHAHGQRV